jgi:hypothetical protein
MSTQLLSLNKNEPNVIERDVKTISVGVGKLSVVPRNEDPFVLDAGETHDVGDIPVTVLALEGCNYSVEYTELDGTEAPILPREVPETLAPAVRGDTGGGDSGGFESRTVKQLRAEAKKRKLNVKSKATKAELIKALRG